jgi:translocation and assembly module TamA
MLIRLLIALLILLNSFSLLASTLSVDISGDLSSKAKQNIQAYLGDLPKDSIERDAFVFSAIKKTVNALKAIGYYRATVSSSVNKDLEKDRWVLTINVRLNSPTLIDTVNVVLFGDALNDPSFEGLISDIPIEKGDALHHGVYEQFKADLTALALERGYFDNKFTQSTVAINKNLKTADVVIHFDSGVRYQFGQVTFSDFEINANVLQQLVPFESGSLYQRTALQTLQNELDETRYFSSVIVRPETENTSQNQLPVSVSLEKAKSHQLGVGLGYATDTKSRVSLNWKTPLLNRYGHRQETRLSYSTINPTGYFLYSIPLSHPNDDLLQLKTELAENEFGDLTSRYYSFQAGRLHTEQEALNQTYVKYLKEKWHTNGFADIANYLIAGFTWSDLFREGPILDPSNGFRHYYNVEAGYKELLSETSFIRINARWKYVSLLAPKHRFVTRAELGYIFVDKDVGEDLSPSLRFYAGGDQSVRGFEYQSIGPKITLPGSGNDEKEIVIGGTNMIVGSVEYQYYFSKNWRGAVFADGGSVNDTDKLDLVYSAGTGIHYLSPVGPIRLMLGYPLSKDDPSWRVHFSIGVEL